MNLAKICLLYFMHPVHSIFLLFFIFVLHQNKFFHLLHENFIKYFIHHLFSYPSTFYFHLIQLYFNTQENFLDIAPILFCSIFFIILLFLKNHPDQ